MRWKRNDGCLKDEFLQCFIDDELDKNELEEIKIHLDECEGCLSRLNEQKRIVEQLHSGFNSLNIDQIEIPEFRSHKTFKNRRNIKKIYFQWSAAAVVIILLSVFLFKKPVKTEEIETTYIIYDLGRETDANKPWQDQSMTLFILDDSGKMLDEINL